MNNIRRTITYASILVAPILLYIFVQFQEMAKDDKLFLPLMFSSFIFLGLEAFFLLSSEIEEAHRGVRYILYAITTVSIIVILIVASSIATVPRGGTRHSYYIPVNNVEGTITWDKKYYGTFEQILCEVDYPVGLVNAYWDMGGGVHLNVIRGDYRENLTGRLRFWLELWPGQIYRFEEATFTLYGSGEYVKFYSPFNFLG